MRQITLKQPTEEATWNLWRNGDRESSRHIEFCKSRGDGVTVVKYAHIDFCTSLVGPIFGNG